MFTLFSGLPLSAGIGAALGALGALIAILIVLRYQNPARKVLALDVFTLIAVPCAIIDASSSAAWAYGRLEGGFAGTQTLFTIATGSLCLLAMIAMRYRLYHLALPIYAFSALTSQASFLTAIEWGDMQATYAEERKDNAAENQRQAETSKAELQANLATTRATVTTETTNRDRAADRAANASAALAALPLTPPANPRLDEVRRLIANPPQTATDAKRAEIDDVRAWMRCEELGSVKIAGCTNENGVRVDNPGKGTPGRSRYWSLSDRLDVLEGELLELEAASRATVAQLETERAALEAEARTAATALRDQRATLSADIEAARAAGETAASALAQAQRKITELEGKIASADVSIEDAKTPPPAWASAVKVSWVNVTSDTVAGRSLGWTVDGVNWATAGVYALIFAIGSSLFGYLGRLAEANADPKVWLGLLSETALRWQTFFHGTPEARLQRAGMMARAHQIEDAIAARRAARDEAAPAPGHAEPTPAALETPQAEPISIEPQEPIKLKLPVKTLAAARDSVAAASRAVRNRLPTRKPAQSDKVAPELESQGGPIETLEAEAELLETALSAQADAGDPVAEALLEAELEREPIEDRLAAAARETVSATLNSDLLRERTAERDAALEELAELKEQIEDPVAALARDSADEPDDSERDLLTAALQAEIEELRRQLEAARTGAETPQANGTVDDPLAGARLRATGKPLDLTETPDLEADGWDLDARLEGTGGANGAAEKAEGLLFIKNGRAHAPQPIIDALKSLEESKKPQAWVITRQNALVADGLDRGAANVQAWEEWHAARKLHADHLNGA